MDPKVALKEKNIAIIGAGIAGLTTAIALSKRGASVSVYEQAKDLTDVGAGIQISPNAIRACDALGIDLKKTASPNIPKHVCLMNGLTGKPVVSVLLNQNPAQPYLQVHRADLLSCLASRASDLGVHMHMGNPVSVKETPAAFDLNDVKINFDVIIGADGVKSKVRDTCLSGQSPRFSGAIAWRALVPCSSTGAVQQTKILMGPKRHLVTYPLRNGRVTNVVGVLEVSTPHPEGWAIPDDPENFQHAFQGWCPEVTDLLSAVETPKLWGLYDHPELAHWTRKNLVVIGDAAHPMMPYMAQGACMAIEDAWSLGAHLEAYADVPDALLHFQNARRPRTTKVQKTAAKNGVVYHLENPIIQKAVHTGMGLIGRFAPTILAGRFNWIYDFDVTQDL